MPTSGIHLDQLTHLVLQNSDDADRLAQQLSGDQLMWRPSANRWSVAEWFEYLVAFGEDCQARIREPMLAAWHDPAFEDAPYKRTIAGGWSAFGTRLRAKRQRGHVVPPPATSSSPARFVAQQGELLDLLDEARDVDLRGVHVGSLFSRLMGPCLGDVLERLITRQRHGIVQATLIARLPNFPGKSRSGRHTTAEMRQTA
jgi:DinB superfamily